MKPIVNPFVRTARCWRLLAGTIVSSLTFAATLQAGTYNWSKLTVGTYNWDEAGGQDNWTETGYPNLADDTANLNKAITGIETINLNVPITIGTLNLGSTSGTGVKTTIAAGTAGTLTMDVGTGNALIAKTTTLNRQEDVISANIQLNDNLTLNCAQTDARGWLTISGIISGTGKTAEKTGAGLVRLVGAQQYDGGTTISAGTLQLGSGATGGNGSVVGNIVNNGMLAFNNADSQTLAVANYSGTGGLEKKGAGTLNLTGASWTVGGSFIADAGTIAIDSSSTWSVGGGSSSVFYVGVGWGGLNALGENHTATLDLTAATSFSANVGKFLVGVTDSVAGGGTGVGTLKLGNSSITATNVVIGGSLPDQNGASSNGGKLEIASGATVTIVSPLLSIGTSKAIASGFVPSYLKLMGTGATLNLGNSTTRTAVTIGSNTSGDMQNKTWTGEMDLSTGAGSLYLSGLILAKNGFGGTNANVTGNMKLGSASNVLDISGATIPVKIGYGNLSSTYTTTAALTISNLASTSAITATDDSTAIVIASKAGTAPVSGTLTLNSGTLTITTTGSAIAGGGGTSTLVLGDALGVGTGMTLKAGASGATPSTSWITGLTSATIKTTGVTFDTAGFDIMIDQNLAADTTDTGGGLTKTGAGTLKLSGVNTYAGSTKVNQGTLALGASGSLATSGVEVAAGAVFDTTAQSYAIPATLTLHVDPAGSGSSGKITAGTLDISSATVVVTIDGTDPLDDNAYVLADYTASSLTGTSFLSVTDPPFGYQIDYAYNSGTQIAWVKSSGYSTWASDFDPALSDPAADADPDGDGLANAIEYVLGTDPRYSNPGGPQTDATGSDFVLTFNREDASETSDLTLVVEISDDLVDWTTHTSYTVGADTASSTEGVTVDENEGAADTIEVTVPKDGNTKLFGRLRAVVTE